LHGQQVKRTVTRISIVDIALDVAIVGVATWMAIEMFA
jgi:hypothetical protein